VGKGAGVVVLAAFLACARVVLDGTTEVFEVDVEAFIAAGTGVRVCVCV
jgi:hypothetical protein